MPLRAHEMGSGDIKMKHLSDLLSADVLFNLHKVTVLEDQRLVDHVLHLNQPLAQSLHTALQLCNGGQCILQLI